jgi:hypothetical protein
MLSTPTTSPGGLPYWTASILLPGWAQLCQARMGFIFWYAFALLAYWHCIPLGLAVHLLCIVDAAVYSVRCSASRESLP